MLGGYRNNYVYLLPINPAQLCIQHNAVKKNVTTSTKGSTYISKTTTAKNLVPTSSYAPARSPLVHFSDKFRGAMLHWRDLSPLSVLSKQTARPQGNKFT